MYNSPTIVKKIASIRTATGQGSFPAKCILYCVLDFDL